MRLWQSKKEKNEQGTILMEAVICLPVLLLVSLGVAQFAHIWLCRTIVQYAAYCGARTSLVAAPGTETTQAANATKTICSVITFFNPTSEDDFIIPGIFNNQKIDASGGAASSQILQTSVVTDSNGFHSYTDVKMKVPLIIPFAGPVIGKVMQLYNTTGEFSPGNSSEAPLVTPISGDLYPRIELHERVYMAKPYLCTWGGN